VMYEQIRPHNPFVCGLSVVYMAGNSVCLNMNGFYLGLIPEKETCGVESLEPFDAFEVSYSNLESTFPPPLAVRPMFGQLCVECLGMASMPLGPGLVLLTGGPGWGGREDTTARVLIRAKGGWRCACSVLLPGVILYHTVTSVLGRGVVVFGGRSSPLNPIRTLLRMTYDNVTCLTPLPLTTRWRHTLTMGRTFDAHFLCLDGQCWTEVADPRFSHSACPYEGGAVICGGLGRESVPLGDTVLLRPTTTGFCWERLHLQPLYVHVIGDWLMLVGGVCLPTVISLCPTLLVCCTLASHAALLLLGTPSARHSFCSTLLGDSDQSTTMALIGGEGNWFSVVTHHNLHPITVDLKPVL
uniref:Leucine carboxyl methyltransferase 2 n=1 Tax=Salmo trutta TaxID=8032 RepID=A0A673XWN6_SALTR